MYPTCEKRLFCHIIFMGNFKFYDMARQVGLLKLAGTLEDISFYKAVYGYLARAKGGVDRKTILTDPRFQRTRENAFEFGRGGVTL